MAARKKSTRKKATTRKVEVVEAPVQTAKERKEQQRWQAQSDIRALQEAKEIRKDKARLGRARTEADSQEQSPAFPR